MEPRSEAEMTAILRARRLAARERLHQQAEGSRWGPAIALALFLVPLLAVEFYFDQTMRRDIGSGVDSLKSAGAGPPEAEALRIALLDISRHVASLVFLVAMLAGMLVVGTVAWLNSRMDAIFKLISEDAER
jgi:hypothetical protein